MNSQWADVYCMVQLNILCGSVTRNLFLSAKPQNVYFTNFSNWDLNVDVLNLDEGQTENVGCGAIGGVPLPRFEIVVGENNYTRKFKDHEWEVSS